MTYVPPDDFKRSPSGRVPRWVVDEAHGRTPTDLVPFRADTSPTLMPPRKRRRWLRTSAWVAGSAILVVGGLFLNDSATSGGTADPFAKPESTRYPDRPLPGTGEQKNRLLPAVTATGSTSFRVSAHQKGDSEPVTWSPCRAIHYVVRGDHAPAQGAQLITQAFTALSAATGLSFANDGSTTEGPVEDREDYQKSVYGDRWAPVLVTWATPDEVPDFGIDFLGEAGPSGSYTTPSEDKTYVSGTVALDAVKLGAYARNGRTDVVEATILHELGHLVGLAHVNDRTQIMYPRVGDGRVSYGAGDRAGLAKLGAGPCQPDI